MFRATSIFMALLAISASLAVGVPAASASTVGDESVSGFRCTVLVIEPINYGDGATFRVDWTPVFGADVDRYIVKRRAFGVEHWRGRTAPDTRQFVDSQLPAYSSRVEYRVDARDSKGALLATDACAVVSNAPDRCEVEQRPDGGFDVRWDAAQSVFGSAVIRRQVTPDGPFYWRGKSKELEFSDGPSPNRHGVVYQILQRERGLISAVDSCSFGLDRCEADLTPFSNSPSQLSSLGGALVGDRYFQAGSSGRLVTLESWNLQDRSVETLLTLGSGERIEDFVELGGLVYYLGSDAAFDTDNQNFVLFELDPATGVSRRISDRLIRNLGATERFLYLQPGRGEPRVVVRFDPSSGEAVSLDEGVTGAPIEITGSSPGYFFFRTFEGNSDFTYVYDEEADTISLFSDDLRFPVFSTITTLDGVIYYRNSGPGAELWSWDPSTGSSTPIADFAAGPDNAVRIGQGDFMAAIDGRLAFNASISDLGSGLFTYDVEADELRLQGPELRPITEWNGLILLEGRDRVAYQVELCP